MSIHPWFAHVGSLGSGPGVRSLVDFTRGPRVATPIRSGLARALRIALGQFRHHADYGDNYAGSGLFVVR